MSAAYGLGSQTSIIPPLSDPGIYPWISNLDMGQYSSEKWDQSCRTSDYNSCSSSINISIKENEETEPVDHMKDGLYLLTEGITCMEKRGTVHHSSVDSYHHKKYDNLQILCDVANQQIKEKVGFVT